jgi:putative ABC transport system ATP-binding protein
MTHSTVAQLSGIEKSFARGPEIVEVLRGLSLDLNAGEVVAIIGPSGSGKTTLLNIMAGWEEPDAGEATFVADGAALSFSGRMWNEVAVVPQSLGLLEELTIGENVGLPLRLRKVDNRTIRDEVERLLAAFGLDAYYNRLPQEISIGEQQRTALARALIAEPALILADEPTGHQDAAWAERVFSALREAAARGTACFVATHSDEMLSYCDRVLGIFEGRISDPSERLVPSTGPAYAVPPSTAKSDWERPRT